MPAPVDNADLSWLSRELGEEASLMRISRILVLAVMMTMVGCSDKLPGTYVGDLDVTRSASVTVERSGAAPEVARFSGGKHTAGATAIIRAREDGYRVEIPECAFDAVRNPDQNGLRVAPEQSCTVDLDGRRVVFAVSGSGRIDSASKLTLTLMGAASTRNAAGGVGWSFVGAKR